jgi:hypothetical protein
MPNFSTLMNPVPPSLARHPPTYEFDDSPFPPSQYDPFNLRQALSPHQGRSSAHGSGSSVVHGNMNIRSVTYSGSGSGNEENIPPDGSDQAFRRARKRPRPENSTDTISSFSSHETPFNGNNIQVTTPTVNEGVSIELVDILARQHNLNDANKTMLFSFHRVCFVVLFVSC